jgi:hypothetical protein
VDGADEVRRRVNLLDDTPPDQSADKMAGDLLEVVNVMAPITNGYIIGTYGRTPIVSANDVDKLVQNCVVVDRIGKIMPSMTVGPITLESQAWIGVPMTSFSPRRHPQLDREHFLGPSSSLIKPLTKPTSHGLFSSTIVHGTNKSMWHIYLEAWGGTLFPRPWHIYKLVINPRARVLEINRAKDWVRLVEDCSIEVAGLLYPDWSRLSRDYDGVHMTIAAIVAMQGLRLSSPKGLIVETYWDVESTLWLNWVFNSWVLIQVA